MHHPVSSDRGVPSGRVLPAPFGISTRRTWWTIRLVLQARRDPRQNLGVQDVLNVAPPGTYAFAPGYRRRMLHAHHAQQLQNKGALGGRNLLILCSYHHDIWGDHLSREKVLEGLGNSIESLDPRVPA